MQPLSARENRKRNLKEANEGTSGLIEDRVRPDTAPDNVSLSLSNHRPVLESCSAVVGPSHLEYPSRTLDTLYAKSRAEFLRGQVLDELPNGIFERFLLRKSECREIASEAVGRPVGRHAL